MVLVFVIKINSLVARYCGGWGNSSGGCRLLQVLLWVLTCRLLSICVRVYVLVLVCFRNNMVDFLTAIPKQAKEIGRNTGEIKTRLWIKLDMSTWALLEQIRTHPVHKMFEDEHETIAYCIMAKARELGLETG